MAGTWWFGQTKVLIKVHQCSVLGLLQTFLLVCEASFAFLLGRVVQSPIKLTQGWRDFLFQFCNFLVSCSVYIVCPSVLSCSNLKLHQTLEVKNIFKHENIVLQLPFNPGLT